MIQTICTRYYLSLLWGYSAVRDRCRGQRYWLLHGDWIFRFFDRSNLMGTKFTVYDNGVNPMKTTSSLEASILRQELAAICYVSTAHRRIWKKGQLSFWSSSLNSLLPSDPVNQQSDFGVIERLTFARETRKFRGQWRWKTLCTEPGCPVLTFGQRVLELLHNPLEEVGYYSTPAGTIRGSLLNWEVLCTWKCCTEEWTFVMALWRRPCWSKHR